MKKILLTFFKYLLWLAVALTISIFSFTLGISAFGWGEHPLGHRLHIYAWFHNPIAFDVFFTPSGSHTHLVHIVPTSYSNAYDTITGKRKESVQRVIRYPDYLAITVVDNNNGNKKYFIIDKNFDPQKATGDLILEKNLFETSDSVIFKSKCDSLARHR